MWRGCLAPAVLLGVASLACGQGGPPAVIARSAPPAQAAPAAGPVQLGRPLAIARAAAPEDGDPLRSAPQPRQPANDVRDLAWGSVEYLLWWVKDGPLPVPLVTTGNPAAGALAGTLGQPDTRVLFGRSGLDYGTFSGLRLTVGSWLDDGRCVGVEGRGFLLHSRTVRFSAASNAAGEPPLYLPAFNAATGREDSLIVADPLQQFSGGVSISSKTSLWGAEVNGLWNLDREAGFTLDLLGGFRYLGLNESLHLANVTQDLLLGTVTSLEDRFDTRNRFYGGQVGARAGFAFGLLSASVTGKLAMGPTRQTVNINGGVLQEGALAPTPGAFAGGFFTQPSNIGNRHRNHWSVVPELAAQLAYEFLPGFRAFVGYDFLYWTQVVRPGNQIDRVLNLSQSPVLGAGTLAGPARPAPRFDRSDFWAQGFTFGLMAQF